MTTATAYLHDFSLRDMADGPKWVEILRTGDQRSRRVDGSASSGQQVVSFTRDDLESMVRGFSEAKAAGFFPGGMAPVGFDHDEFASALAALTGEAPSAADRLSLAAGFDDVRVEENADGGWSLMARHEFTELGRKVNREGGIKGYSIDVAPPGLAQRSDGTPIAEFVPFGGTLTRSPFVRGMAPVAASDTPHKEASPMLVPIIKALSLADGATEALALEAVTALKARASALSDALTVTTSDRDALKVEVSALSDWKQSRLGDDAVAAGRCSKAEVAEYLKAVSALGEAHAHKVYPEQRIATRVAAPGAGAPATGEVVLGDVEDHDAKFEAVYGEARATGKSEREAYMLADEATRAARSIHYRAAQA